MIHIETREQRFDISSYGRLVRWKKSVFCANVSHTERCGCNKPADKSLDGTKCKQLVIDNPERMVFKCDTRKSTRITGNTLAYILRNSFVLNVKLSQLYPMIFLKRLPLGAAKYLPESILVNR